MTEVEAFQRERRDWYALEDKYLAELKRLRALLTGAGIEVNNG